jgi:hypothetical protein
MRDAVNRHQTGSTTSRRVLNPTIPEPVDPFRTSGSRAGYSLQGRAPSDDFPRTRELTIRLAYGQ